MQILDPRKEYILRTAGNFFGVSEINEKESNKSALSQFLDTNDSCLYAVKDSQGIIFENKFVARNGDPQLIFFKVGQQIVTWENFRDVLQVTSLARSPMQSLFHNIHSVFLPALQQDDAEGFLDPQLQSLISQLESGLRSTLYKNDPDGSTHGIFTLQDECRFWKQQGNKSTNSEQSFDLLESLDKELRAVQSGGLLSDLKDAIDMAQSTLDELWNLEGPAYSQSRMVQLMDVLANDITRIIQGYLSKLDVWQDAYNTVNDTLLQAISCANKWSDSCNKLTTLFWPSVSSHAWKGPAHESQYLKKFELQLKEVLRIRSLHHQLTNLLSEEEKKGLEANKLFEIFSGMNITYYDVNAESRWENCALEFEKKITPMEERVASRLQRKLGQENSHPLQLLQEMNRQRELVCRPNMLRLLTGQRESLLAALLQFTRGVHREMSERQSHHTVADNVSWARQMQAKITDIKNSGKELLGDLSEFPKLASDADRLLTEVREFSTDVTDSWTRHVSAALANRSLGLRTDAPVVQFESGKELMRVTYDARLVTLLREARALTVLGHKLPVNIERAVEQAKKFVKQAKALEQVANFHNTIGDRMVLSQRPMMLEAALGLAKLVQQESCVTWADSKAVDAYLVKLQAAVERLARNNALLTAYHNDIRNKVKALMATDLLRNQNLWKQGVNGIRDIFAQVEAQKFGQMRAWRAHWDRQLYKALELQYQVGLESLSEHLPEMKVELVFRQQKLQFQPPMEEIRSKYYAQLRRFLALPNSFRGVQDGNEKPIFPAIVERNARRFGPLFSRAEELFGRLESLKTRFERWVALGSVDLESMVQSLSSAEDWERNFRASKAWGQEIARLTCLEEKLECFTVSFLPVRAEAEVHNRRYWDMLAGSLHSSVRSDVTSVESFAQEGTQVLRLQPHTAEEIGKVSKQHAQLLKSMSDMVARHAEAVKKNNVLAAWTKERVEAVDKIASVWETLLALLDNHDSILSRQVESIKASLSTRSEELGTQAQKFWIRWQQLKPADSTSGLRDSATLQKTFQALTERKEEWTLLQQTRHQLKEEYEQFGLSLPDVLQWEEIEKDLQTQEATWSLFNEFQTGLNEISNEEWIAFRSKSFKFEEFLCRSEQKMREMTEREGVVPLMVCLLREVEQYQALLPVLKYVKGDMFSEKHWAEMLDMLSIPNKPVENLLFRDFLDVKENILAQTEQLQELNARAASEIVIRQALNELDVWEVEAKFSLFEHVDSQGKHLFLVQDFKDLLNKVGDNQCLLQSIRGSPNFDRFADQASIWEKRLVTLDECLRHLNQIQRKWLYLEPIFGGGMLAHDKARFARVDVDFRHIAADITRDKRVLSLCRRAGLSQSLQNLLDQLGRCQKSLKDFLEEKRSAFPRFYFIGDDDLLEILGQSTKEKVVQAHLKKLFAGIHSVQFDESGNNIVAMRSLEGEVVPLLSPVKLTQQVEHWLGQLVTEMRRTLQRSLVQCLEQARKSSSGADPLSYPSQILCLTESIMFTERCELAITSSKLQTLLTSLKSQLWSYTSQELPQEGDVLELKLRALILDTIYHINIVKKLMDDEKGLSVDSWQWQKCLRFYLKNDGKVVAKMVDAEFSYTYEYLGNAPKLVHTPLTDKCYLTLTQAMHLGLGGNPLGPAGTGKTESVKALGGLLGRQVLVFNCDEGIDVKSMTRIFVGLAKCGAWGCFDEFNRLEEATLSAISMQIQPIQAALKAKQPSVNIMGEEISLDPNSGIFVTMNPAGKGYGGRQKLPDNLKQLFRPVVMCQPDSEQIAEVLLHMEGFRTAADLGTRLVEVFTLAKRLLSCQQHYDWGLRALKTVLQGCGAALRAARSTKPVDEAQLAVQVLRLNIFSKLTAADCSRLDALLRDVFPKVSLLDSSDQQLEVALKNSCMQLQLEENAKQIHKCIEVYKQLQQRMGVVLMGPTGSGKSTVLNLLKHALRGLGHNVRRHTISPKSMPRAQLLGYVDPDTRQWQDGVLTVIAQQVHSEPQDVFSWVVCDGDVDPEWVESLNSVLDDNRLLTLPSGWRIQFGPNVNFLFETHDLSQASPATISRMGIVLLSHEDIDIKQLVTAWIKQMPENSVLKQLIEDYFFKALDWVLQQGEAVVPCSPVGLVRSGLSQFHDVTSTSHFTCALLRGLGSHLTANSRETFATQVLQWTGEYLPDPSTAHLCFYDERRDCLDTYTTDTESLENAHSSQLVPTASVKSVLGHLEACFQEESKQSFLLAGPPGCGKSTILKYCFSKLRSTEVAEIHCSAQITPELVMQKLSQVTIATSNSTGRVIRSKNSEHLILYLRDLNLSKPDKWGTSMLVEFLRQVLTYGGFYDQKLEWVSMEGIQIVATMVNSTGRHPLSPRFLSLLTIYTCSYPERGDLRSIYGSLLHTTLAPVMPQFGQWHSSGKLLSIVDTMISLYSEVTATFTPLQHSHYVFSPCYLSRWCHGLARYDYNTSRDPVECLLQVLVHEAQSLFQDMLCTEEERTKFVDMLSTTIEDKWNRSASALFAKLSDVFYVSVAATSKKNAVLPHGQPLGQLYKEDWTTIVDRVMTQTGREQQSPSLLLIPELLRGVARVERVLTAPYGNLLLAGQVGAGRKSAVQLVSVLHGARLVTPNMASGYNVKHFKNEIKAAMQMAGLESQQIFLLIEAHQIVEPSFLDIINSLLAAGEVPGLYAAEELEPLVSSLREIAAQEGFVGGPISYFAENVRRNLHLILVMDCTDIEFVRNCDNYPALYKHCVIQWWDSWDDESMLQIPQKFLQKDAEGDESLVEDESIYEHLLTIHKQAPSKQLHTPRRYVAFVHLYRNILATKHRNIRERQSKLKAGVSKLTEARQVVAELRSQAEIQEKQLAEKQQEAATALHLISETMQGANTQKLEMEGLKEQTMRENEQLLKRKKAIDLELAEIEPLIKEAQAAVGNIKAEALSEIRSLRAPPDVIRDILEGVLRLMGIQDTSWNSMKTFLAKRGVKEDIRAFNARNINVENRVTVEKLLREKADSFEPKNAKRASVAAAPLAAWVNANVKYSIVLEKIRPLEREQNKLHKNLQSAEDNIGKLSSELSDVGDRVAKLKERLNTMLFCIFYIRNLQSAEDNIGKLSSELSDVGDRVAKLKERLNTYTKEAAEIEIHLKQAKDTLLAAENLVGKLNEEYERWKAQLQELTDDLSVLPLHALLAAAFVAYLSGLAEEHRRTLLQDWQSRLGLEHFSMRRFLASEQELLLWQGEGLPSDQLSVENAITILQISHLEQGTALRPLLVDPSSQAVEWLKRHMKNRALEVVTQTNERFTTLLELAVRFGKVLIIQDVDSVNPILLPLLRGDLNYQGTRCVVNIGGKLVDYHKDFELYLVSRSAKPDVAPGAAAVLTMVDFSTTQAGLSGQLLGCALRHDKPELEARRGELLAEEEKSRARLDQLQEKLLLKLSSAQGDVLQNKELLASLNETKASSASISASLNESSKLQAALEVEREAYRPLAHFGSLLYFATLDLAHVNSTYHFSVSAFLRLFQQALDQLELEEDTEARIAAVKRCLLRLLYNNVGRALFKKDRLMFAMHLVHKINPQLVPENEWQVFTGQVTVDNSGTATLPKWLSEDKAKKLVQSIPPALLGQLQLEKEAVWSEFMVSGEAESHLPAHLDAFSAFQRVMVVQALRPDRLHTMMQLFAQKSLGLHDLSPSALSLKKLVSETQPSEPIMLLALPGADPSEELRNLALNTVGQQAYFEVALGQGQLEMAEQLLRDAVSNGHWLCLKNLHLVCKWLPELESLLGSLQPHESFRLWLTSQPHPALSPVLMQSCLKITYEAPQGIKRNLQRTYAAWGRETVENSGRFATPRAQVLFALGWLHAVLQERGSYVPQGWSQHYEFSDADLRCALIVLETLLNTGRIKWDYIYGLYETAIYGGRVDNEFDLRVLSIYVRNYFNSDVLNGSKFGPGIVLPSSAKFTDSLNVINQLPDQDKPEYFGLPANIDRSWQRLTSASVIRQLLLLSSPLDRSTKHDYTKWESQLSPILNLWKKLNQTGGLVQSKLPSETSKPECTPLQQFCASEWRSAVHLIHTVHRSLASLLRVMRGAALPNSEMIELAEAIITHQTPDAWLQLWAGPAEPLQFLRSIVSKALAVQKWNQSSNLQGQTLNFSDLLHPEAFLSALKQQTARTYGVAVSELRLLSSWSSTLPTARLAVTVSGLMLEGATFRGGSLAGASSSTPSVSPLPPCAIAWVPKNEMTSCQATVELPLYQSANRQQLITSLELPCTVDKQLWLLAGVALFLEL